MAYEPSGFTLPDAKVGFGETAKLTESKIDKKPSPECEGDEVVYESSLGWIKPKP